jgi:hypothetical protein
LDKDFVKEEQKNSSSLFPTEKVPEAMLHKIMKDFQLKIQ